MFRKMMKLLTNNLGLKILSILAAVVLWLVVVNLDNPEKTKSFTVPVTVTNEEILTEMGKVYEVVGDSDVATIYVTGKRSLLDSMSSADFKATADLGQMDFQGTGETKMIPINVSAIRHEKDLEITQKTVNMQITIEDLSTEQFYISCTTQGSPAEGYAIGEASASPNLIKVSGPRSVVSQVKRVVANVDVEGATGTVTDSVVPELYDEDDKLIESTQLQLNQEKITVSIQMLGTKEVTVKCLTAGEPAEGYQFVQLDYAPETISIKGEPSVLNEISEITIPAEAVDLTGATGTVENSIDITPYLEELGVSLVDPEENKIAVKAEVERLETKTLELPVGNIQVLNLGEAYELSFGETTVSVSVRGRQEELQELNVEGLTASIDLNDYDPGDYTVDVLVKVEDRFQVLGTVTAQVHITQEITEEDADTEEEAVETGSTAAGSGSTGSNGKNETGNENGGSESTGTGSTAAGSEEDDNE